jgi:hypothetical protein
MTALERAKERSAVADRCRLAMLEFAYGKWNPAPPALWLNGNQPGRVRMRRAAIRYAASIGYRQADIARAIGRHHSTVQAALERRNDHGQRK